MRTVAAALVLALLPLSSAIGGSDASNLAVVCKYESRCQNEPWNYMVDKKHTASGYYQLTNENWRKIAPTLDIDTTKFPTAGSASKELQARVASKLMFLRGYQPWAVFNPRLRQALGGKADVAPKGAANVNWITRLANTARADMARITTAPHPTTRGACIATPIGRACLVRTALGTFRAY